MRIRAAHGLIWVLALAGPAGLACDDGSSGGDADTDVDSDTDADTDTDTGCTEGEASCLEDARTLRRCEGGAWQDVDCLATAGQLCEDGACVERWRFGSPSFSTCDAVTGTTESLADKAAHYDRLAAELHVHPDHELMVAVRLKDGADEATATWQDVASWNTGENDGLWNGTYLASQAFRYAATRGTAEAEQALDNLRLVLSGNERQMAITGVPGLYTREYRTPGIEGMTCPAEPERYRTDPEKDDNTWVQIRDDGCAWRTDEAGTTWLNTGHCGYDASFTDYCWLDNVSQDEYAGHYLALGLIGKLVDDAALHERVVTLAEAATEHLVDHDLQYVDYDGRTTEHGRMYALAGDDFPGFNAMLSLAWVKVGAELSGRADLQDFYERCLMQADGQDDCQPNAMGIFKPYTDWLDTVGLYVSESGCINNWNNFNMFFMSAFLWLLYETDADRLAEVQGRLEDEWMGLQGYARPMREQDNSFFNFIYAATKALGPGSSGPAYGEVEAAVCTLKRFPASQSRFDSDPASQYDEACLDRLDHPMSDEVIPIDERCPGSFVWTRNPYSLSGCTADPLSLATPADYLLAYWMGRYFGFVPAEL